MKRRANKLRIKGKKFGRLIVLRETGIQKGRTKWLCKCDCGRTKEIMGRNLSSGRSRSCGYCNRVSGKKNKRHGETIGGKPTAEYRTWCSMRSRCRNPKTPGYAYYGGRGISVCERWNGSFENFLEDMGRRPTSEHSIDRINVNGNYEPVNCRWATKSEQTKNRRAASAQFLTDEELLVECKRRGLHV